MNSRDVEADAEFVEAAFGCNGAEKASLLANAAVPALPEEGNEAAKQNTNKFSVVMQFKLR